MSAIFDFSDHLALIEEFVSKVPRLLESSPITADLAKSVSHLVQSSETPFTLAVVGQMRAGKSTLINALAGADLAITGVNETTATINWFKFGTGEQSNSFRVHWKHRPEEELPLTEIARWVGNSELAEETKFLEFFRETEFLRAIYVVDTPGTRSVLSSHEETLRNFLAEKRERETLEHGGAADAILYVLMPVARDTDEDLLRSFEQKTRFAGASPYNSVAVMHKWEAIEAEDPFAEASKKAARMMDRLKEHVSGVLPVSAPLSIASATLPQSWWEAAADFVRAAALPTLERMLSRGEQAFCTREFPGCPGAAERAQLLERSRLPWPCFRALLLVTGRRGAHEPDALRGFAFQMAGTTQLLEFLQTRFFARAKLIKAYTLLARALDPCSVAQIRLRNKSSEIARRRSEGAAALNSIGTAAQFQHSLRPAQQFIEHTLADLVTLDGSIEKLERSLSDRVRSVRDTFERLNGDAQAIRLIDDGKVRLTPEERNEARAILGCCGSSLRDRCAPFAGDGSTAERVLDRLEYWNSRAESSFGAEQQLASQVTSRLGEIADMLEKQSLCP